MLFREKIRAAAEVRGAERIVQDVRIGLGYTAVHLAGGGTGAAYTFHDDLAGGCTVFKGLRPLAGRPAKDLLGLFDSSDNIESAVALATANAILNTGRPGLVEGDILQYLDLCPGDHVAMVGYFAPLIKALREKSASLDIFELDRSRGADTLPAGDLFQKISGHQVALLTATAIINNTIDGLLEACSGCREVALLGASTPLAPEVFEGTPVSLLSGVVVTGSEALLAIVSEGGGMRLFGPAVKKVSLPRK